MEGRMEIVAALLCLLLSCGRVKAKLMDPQTLICVEVAQSECNVEDHKKIMDIMLSTEWNEENCRTLEGDGRCMQDHLTDECKKAEHMQELAQDLTDRYAKYCDEYAIEKRLAMEASSNQGNQTRGDGILLLTGLLFGFFLTALCCMI